MGYNDKVFCIKTIEDPANADVVTILCGLVQDIIEATSRTWKWNWHYNSEFVCIAMTEKSSQKSIKLWIDGHDLFVKCNDKVYKICLSNPRHINEIVKLLK